MKPLQARPRLPARKSRRPRKLGDLLSASLTSVSLVFNFREHRIDIGLDEIDDADFLYAVASALMSAVDHGLYIARRICDAAEGDWPPMASPFRVYFVPPRNTVHIRDAPGGRLFEPDALIPGVGPAVKLLHAVLQRMAEVGEFLTALDDRNFWIFPSFPEFAELRAVRFGDLEPETQALIIRRLRKGLPRKFFPRKMEAEEIRSTRRGFSAMELRRIEIGGGMLPARERDWLLEAADEFPGLKKMTIDGGFRDPWVLPYFPPITNPKSRFDELQGEARLQALEDALSDEACAHQASDWLRKPDRAVHISRDLEAAASLVYWIPNTSNYKLTIYQ